MRRGQNCSRPKVLHRKMLEGFQMDQCEPSRTPADLNLKLEKAQHGDEEVGENIYKTLF